MYHRHHRHNHFFGTTIIGAKGQVVVPIEARKAMDLNQGEKLLVFGGPRHALVMVKLDSAEEMFTRLSRQIDSFKKAIRRK